MFVIAGILLSSVLTLGKIDEQSLPDLIRQHHGTVLVVNFWATWCGPCREEFPSFVRLHQEKHPAGVRVVGVSLDEPEDESRAAEFLAGQGADFPNFIRAFRDFEVFVNAIDPEWSGALPATFVFDRSGRLAFKKIGEIEEKELRAAVEPLVAR